MALRGEQVLLRAYFQSADRAPLTPTYELLVSAAREAGLAGATVLRGILGFGSHGVIRRSVWSLVKHVPVIVEIVDSGDRIVSFLSGPAARIIAGGMITLERAHVVVYRPRASDRQDSPTLGGLVPPLSTLPVIEGGQHMTINENGVLLRVFIGESDRVDHLPLYEAIVHKARELGLAGATVLRGIQGFGANSVVHKASLLEMSTDLPIVIEIVDDQERVQALLPYVDQMVKEGLMTMEHVRIVMYREGEGGGGTGAQE